MKEEQKLSKERKNKEKRGKKLKKGITLCVKGNYFFKF